MYNNDKLNSKIISYKANNLATIKKTVSNNFNILICREEYRLNKLDFCLETELLVSGNGGGIIANDANVTLVNYGVMALFNFIKLNHKPIEYFAHCHPHLLMYKLLTSTSDENERGLVRDKKRDSQLKVDQMA